MNRRQELRGDRKVANLVENAVDFAETRVEIGAAWNHREVSVTVSDDGRGFTPPAGLPQVEHFPPLFTVLIARLGVDPLSAARVVNAVAFAGIVLLVGVVVLWRTRSVPAAP